MQARAELLCAFASIGGDVGRAMNCIIDAELRSLEAEERAIAERRAALEEARACIIASLQSNTADVSAAS